MLKKFLAMTAKAKRKQINGLVKAKAFLDDDKSFGMNDQNLIRFPKPVLAAC